VRISVSPEGDAAFAVVDVDTLWRSASGAEQHWVRRAGKFYARVGGVWKMTMHTGLLAYGGCRPKEELLPAAQPG
jgi:hypothetical protein